MPPHIYMIPNILSKGFCNKIYL